MHQPSHLIKHILEFPRTGLWLVENINQGFHLLRNQHNPKTYTIRSGKSLRAHAPNQALLKNGGYQKLAAHMLTSYGKNIYIFFWGGTSTEILFLEI